MMPDVADDQMEHLALPVMWGGADDLPVYAANQFVVQLGPVGHPGEITLTVGYAVSPIITGEDPAEVRKQLEAIKGVEVRVLARYSLTRRRLGELVGILQTAVRQHDEQLAAAGGTEGTDASNRDGGDNTG
jgi:hypothetical protein